MIEMLKQTLGFGDRERVRAAHTHEDEDREAFWRALWRAQVVTARAEGREPPSWEEMLVHDGTRRHDD